MVNIFTRSAKKLHYFSVFPEYVSAILHTEFYKGGKTNDMLSFIWMGKHPVRG